MLLQTSLGSKIVAAAFHESLDNIVLASTKHHGATTLRDAAYATREKGYPPTEVLYVFLLACEAFGHRGSHRQFLFNCLSDLCKLFSFNVMSVTCVESRAVCDMVRYLVFVTTTTAYAGGHDNIGKKSTSLFYGSGDIEDGGGAGRANESTPICAGETESHSSLNSMVQKDPTGTPQMSSTLKKAPLQSLTTMAVGASHVTYTLVEDEDMVMRLLQVVVALSSACPLDNSALAEPLGLLLRIYASVPSSCMAEEVLTATLLQHTHVYCNTLLYSEGDFVMDNTSHTLSGSAKAEIQLSLSSCLQAVAYFKDLCELAAGQQPKSLPLSSAPLASHGLLSARVGSSSSSGGRGELNSTPLQSWFDVIEVAKTRHPLQSEPMFSSTAAGTAYSGSCSPNISCRLRRLALKLLLSFFKEVKSEVSLTSKPMSLVSPGSGAYGEGADAQAITLENLHSGVGVWFFQCLNEKMVSLALACHPSSVKFRFKEGYGNNDGVAYSKDGWDDVLEQAEGSFQDTNLSSSLNISDSAGGDRSKQPVWGTPADPKMATEENEDLFILTQELALVALKKFPIAMRNTAGDLANYHAALLKECRTKHLLGLLVWTGSQQPDMDTCGSDRAAGRTKDMAVADGPLPYREERMLHVMVKVLTLWEKIIGCNSIPDDLFLIVTISNKTLQEESSEQPQQCAEGTFGLQDVLHKPLCPYIALFNEAVLFACDIIKGVATRPGAHPRSSHSSFQELFTESKFSHKEILGATKHKKSRGPKEAHARPSVPKHDIQHPETHSSSSTLVCTGKCFLYLVDVLSFLVVFGRRFAQLVKKICKSCTAPEGGGKAGGGSKGSYDPKNDLSWKRERVLRHVFLSLHTPLLQCVRLALERLEGADEVLHDVLTMAADWFCVCGMFGMPGHQDGYLGALTDALRVEDPAGNALINLALMQHHEAAEIWGRVAQQASSETAEDDALCASPDDTERHGRPVNVTGPPQPADMRRWVVDKIRRITTNLRRGGGPAREPSPLGSFLALDATTVHPVYTTPRSPFCSRDNQLACLISIGRLHRKFIILKTLLAISGHMNEVCIQGWSIIAEALCLVEPLIYRLRLFILWISEVSTGQQQHGTLLRAAYDMREAAQRLCVEAAQQLQDKPFAVFLGAMVRSTERFCSGTQDRLYTLLHPECNELLIDGKADDEKVPHGTAKPQKETSLDSLMKAVPNGFGVFWLFEMMCESLCVAYLSLLPTRATRAVLVEQHMRWLCVRFMHPLRLLRWCELLQYCPLAVSMLGNWGLTYGGKFDGDADGGRGVSGTSNFFRTGHTSDAYHGTGGIEKGLVVDYTNAASESPGATSVAAAASINPVADGALFTDDLHFGAGSKFSELYGALTLCIEDVAGVAAYVSIWSGRLRTAIAASAANGLIIEVTTTGERLFSWVVDPTLPAGPLASKRLFQLAVRLLPDSVRAYSVLSSLSAFQQANNFVSVLASSAGARPCLSTDQVLRHLEENLIHIASCGVDFFALLREILDFFCEVFTQESGAALVYQPLKLPSHVMFPSTDTLSRACLNLSLELSMRTIREVFSLVQVCGENITSESWGHLLCLLRRVVTVASLSSTTTATTVPSLDIPNNDGSHQKPPFVSKSNSTLPGTDENVCVSRMPSMLSPLKTHTLPLSASAHLPRTAYGAVLEEIVQLAYRILEVIQHNYITNMRANELRELILCASAFIVHCIGGAKDKQLHINLSAVQMLWFVADYLAAVPTLPTVTDSSLRSNAGGLTDGMLTISAAAMEQHCQDDLWCSLLLHLQDDGCMDIRQEVRQSSPKTLFSLLQTYGSHFSGDCWHCVLWNVMMPLMDRVLAAQMKCAIVLHPSSPLDNAPNAATPYDQIPNRAHDFVRLLTERQNSTNQMELLNAFEAEPRQIEEMRVTITDSAIRVLLGHYNDMRLALKPLEKNIDTVQSFTNLPHHEVLRHFICFCGEARVVVRGTTGVDSALSAIRALHSLLIELHEYGGEDAVYLSNTGLARKALQGILLRDERTKCTAKSQCTDAVVSALVASLCDSFCLYRERLQRQRPDAFFASTNSLYSATDQRATLATSWPLDGGTTALDVCGASQATTFPDPNNDDNETFFSEIMRVLSVSTTCDAVLDSYYYPNKVQVTLVEAYTAMWPHLDLSERCTVLDTLVWPQFPQDTKIKNLLGAATSEASLTLRDVLPPGAHPNTLLQLLEWIRAVVLSPLFPSSDRDGLSALGCTTAQDTSGVGKALLSVTTQYTSCDEMDSGELLDRVFLRFVAVLGDLLQLQYASAEQLVWQSYGTPFNLSDTFDICLEHLQAVAWYGLLDGTTSTRHSRIVALTTLYSQLIFLATTKAADYDRGSCGSFTEVPNLLQAALATLDRLTVTLCELVQKLATSFDDISGAMDIVAVLVTASTTKAPLLESVARHSLSTLEQWSSIASVFTPSPTGSVNPGGMNQAGPHRVCTMESADEASSASKTRSVEELACEREHLNTKDEFFPVCAGPSASGGRFRAVVRDLMHTRSQSILRQYLTDSLSASSISLTRDLLTSICLRCDALSPPVPSFPCEGEMRENGGIEEVRAERAYMRELLQDLTKLVACADERTSRLEDEVARDKGLRQALSNALLSIYRALGMM